jgi:hypothetical protein
MKVLAEDVACAFGLAADAPLATVEAEQATEEIEHDEFMAQRFPHVRAAGPAVTITSPGPRTTVHRLGEDPNAAHRRLRRLVVESAPQVLGR